MGRKKNGFTLVEMLVVLGIIVMLALFATPKILRQFGKAKTDIARVGIANIEGAIGRFFIDCGQYPTELQDLLEVPAELEEEDDWRGPYLKKSELLDPWKNPYIYVEEGDVNPGSFDLISYGADGQQGGEGDDKEIYNE